MGSKQPDYLSCETRTAGKSFYPNPSAFSGNGLSCKITSQWDWELGEGFPVFPRCPRRDQTPGLRSLQPWQGASAPAAAPRSQPAPVQRDGDGMGRRWDGRREKREERESGAAPCVEPAPAPGALPGAGPGWRRPDPPGAPPPPPRSDRAGSGAETAKSRRHVSISAVAPAAASPGARHGGAQPARRPRAPRAAGARLPAARSVLGGEAGLKGREAGNNNRL